MVHLLDNSILLKLKDPVVVGHTHADPDAVGSAYVVARRLNTIPSFDGSLSREGRSLIRFLDTEYELSPHVEGRDVILVDVSSREMVPSIDIEKARKVIVIDHHKNKINGILIGGENFSSSAEIVYRLFERGGFSPKEKIALAAGIIYDTFFLKNAKGETLSILSKLLEDKTPSYILSIIGKEPLSEKIARLKALKRGEIWSVNDYVAVLSHVGSYEGSSASALIEMGADVAVVYSSKLISARVGPSLHRKVDLTTLAPKGCGGHPHAIGCKNVNTRRVARMILESILSLLSEGRYVIRRH